ncbi:NAD(P)/FAD-dependent oxidoreductase [Peptoniphilus sp. oral taxon 386]|uniref:NAD(P)/FAD-dependent oxidoreductase n=1 Tax=Peptoniphilus sp. oral taxon 386 TaxID=652713 RepID=UPI0001DA999A|nr:NAD(P)/FAD-dependent oxidoreductase [Peptoniphilus sp. oral taxon 386]EFI41436.1 pyridine nucleotide-disulfide oxidoreductase [Peptoniphilus sp. oral taxon 386 str. F0131]
MREYDIVIVGGGPAGLSAAIKAREDGIESILLLERDRVLGGILNQCIHNGFGLHTFKEELTGPEYADRFVKQLVEKNIEYLPSTIVLNITNDKILTIMNENSIENIKAKAVILAMGCRERPRGSLNIPGYRPAGIYTAGTAQRLINMEGIMPGKEVVILGSGDIGLIMARRMSLEGAKVKVVAELMPYSSGLKRNIVQCLDDYGIPLKLSHTIVEIKGKNRVEGIVIAEVDEKLRTIEGTEEYYSCDTILLSCGLIPENELSNMMGVEIDPVTRGPVVSDNLMTNIDGVFACGNVLHVHDLVDYVSEEAAMAGLFAAKYVKSGMKQGREKIVTIPRDGVRYIVPKYIDKQNENEKITLRFRVLNVYKNKNICVYFNDEKIMTKKKKILAPAEMEQIIIKRDELKKYGELKEIIISVEDAE